MTIATTKTVGELAAEMPNATREFEKLGIDYCCGGNRTLGEACAEAKISVDEALHGWRRACGVKSPDDSKDWQNQPLADLVTHIVSTHHVFVREECPRIEALAGKGGRSARQKPPRTAAGAGDLLRARRRTARPSDEGGASSRSRTFYGWKRVLWQANPRRRLCSGRL